MAASFAALIKDFCRNGKIDFLFIEPSGMVTTQELVAASGLGRRDCSYDVGPFVTLVDGADFEFVWAERQRLILAQIAGADLVAVTRADVQTREALAEIRSSLKPYARNLIEVSSVKGLGLEAVVEAVQDGRTEPIAGAQR